MLRIVLASSSPRRRELLAQIGLAFEVRTADLEERTAATQPGDVVEELSRQKAEAVLAMLGDVTDDVLVIGADTVVADGGRILGKPCDQEAAVEMLKGLSGRTHQVYTGVTLLYRRGTDPGETKGEEGGLRRKVFHEMTKVSFYPMSEEEILGYVSTKDCMDKAGAYGIQGIFARYVREIEGDYNNVVGLPVGRLYQEAKEWVGNEEGSDF